MQVHRVDSSENWTRYQLVGDISGPSISGPNTGPLAALDLKDGELSTHLLFDLNDATFLDSSGIGWLLSVNRAAKERGYQVVVHSVPPVIQRVISMMRLNEVLRFAKDFDEARNCVTDKE